jgi:hypothetical protein
MTFFLCMSFSVSVVSFPSVLYVVLGIGMGGEVIFVLEGFPLCFNKDGYGSIYFKSYRGINLALYSILMNRSAQHLFAKSGQSCSYSPFGY